MLQARNNSSVMLQIKVFPFLILTDGDVWNFYLAMAPGAPQAANSPLRRS